MMKKIRIVPVFLLLTVLIVDVRRQDEMELSESKLRALQANGNAAVMIK